MVSEATRHKFEIDRCMCGQEKLKRSKFCKNCTIVVIKKRAFLKDKKRAEEKLWRSKPVEVADSEKLEDFT